ncbi:multidrug ABC transporter ATP-binding protein [Corynebacterium sp. HMSC05H05]|uniref:ABC transporter ATP-binding protein n=1 Tax=unclassified Corynebacterium TaxID=2624378 RepID=UPI0008A211A1|nr:MULTISPECIES: ABC transporter ATP-binding protein [unclassified Corynebacterium]OFT58857.1 multidrug ABC transporter ATP-binding protein [Corynebacterium sp. HMSC05H05]OHR19617.1 multidrug ABC transporter ATP-binding protein [Corynebacterium sp. HMSC034A01]
MENAIEVHQLKRRYGDFTAVNEISLHVAPGEVYGLLGTNGAGKTSTLEVVEGLARPSDGEVRVLGHDPAADRAQVRPHTGIMLQHGGLPQALTVAETMAMWAGTCSAPLPIDEVLRRVQLDHRRDVKVGSLSGGEQRRLDLACALAGNPSLLFLDEPTTGLDPESRRHVWELLRELNSAGVTMVLTTHYLEEAEYLCDRIAIMHRGRIDIEGTPAQLTDTVPSEISFHLDQDLPALPELPGTATHRNGSRVTVTTSHLQRDTLAVLRWADEHALSLRDFAARPASLEQVFQRIADSDTGNDPRKDAA